MFHSLPKALYSSDQTQALDASAINSADIPGIVLMKRAGVAAFNQLLHRWPNVSNICVLSGSGNNGGDGYVVAALAAQKNISVHVFATAEAEKLKGDAKRAYDYAIQEGVLVSSLEELNVDDLDDGTVVVDGVLGTGFNGELRDSISAVFEAINLSPYKVLALDTPSGLDCDTGAAAECALVADLTITFVGVKRGLLTGRGPALTGELVFSDLEIPASVYKSVPCDIERIDSRDFSLPPRAKDAHKGDFGHILVVGGNTGMGGAGLLACEAALRAGAGLVSFATRPEHVIASLARLPEVMACAVESGQALLNLIDKSSVIVLGPGLGKDAWAEQMLDTVLQSEKPVVLDADALNLISNLGRQMELKGKPWIATPHPGEAARLLNMTNNEVQIDRFNSVVRLQKLLGITVVLKGAGSLIASDGSLTLASVGNPGMAVAGMGDVLSGIAGSLLGQGMQPSEAAQMAVCVHGEAGDRAVADGEYGVRASDLMPLIRQCLNRV